jgi:hypothetical protein
VPETIDHDVHVELIGNEQAVAWMEGRIERMRVYVRDNPPPALAVNSYPVVQWQRLFMAQYGKCLGALETLGSFGHLSIEQVKVLETQIKMMLQVHIGAVLLGQQKPGGKL